MIVAFIIWYLLGSVCVLPLIKLNKGEITVGDFCWCMTLGGLFGIIHLFIAIYHTFDNFDIWDRKLF